MEFLRRVRVGDYTIISKGEIVDPQDLIKALEVSPFLNGYGRGRVKLVRFGNEDLFVRQYVHGGLLRGITRDIYLSEKRAVKELLILSYLREKSFPCPEPYCVIVKGRFFIKKLFLITRHIQGTRSLSVALQEATGLKKARYIYGLAKLLSQVFKAGLYHPDFHFSNVLVNRSDRFFLVDFDRAKLREFPRKGDLKDMVLRLYRYLRALERKGELYLNEREKALFLKALNHISGCDIIPYIKRGKKRAEITQRIGWFLESKFYGGKR